MYISVDVEATGPTPQYSMIELGAVVIEPQLDRTFFGQLAPISGAPVEDAALRAIGRTLEETFAYPAAPVTMERFHAWLMRMHATDRDRRLIFVSDNNGFDWQFVNYYLHKYCGSNPFGFSSMNLGSLYKGMVRNVRHSFKHLRITKHSHNALDDAKGNAEAFLAIAPNFDGIKL